MWGVIPTKRLFHRLTKSTEFLLFCKVPFCRKFRCLLHKLLTFGINFADSGLFVCNRQTFLSCESWNEEFLECLEARSFSFPCFVRRPVDCLQR